MWHFFVKNLIFLLFDQISYFKALAFYISTWLSFLLERLDIGQKINTVVCALHFFFCRLRKSKEKMPNEKLKTSRDGRESNKNWLMITRRKLTQQIKDFRINWTNFHPVIICLGPVHTDLNKKFIWLERLSNSLIRNMRQ